MQVELSRKVRFCLSLDGSYDLGPPKSNTYAAWPPMQGLGFYFELEVICQGQVDPVTGYFMNIKKIDDVVRGKAMPVLSAAIREGRESYSALLQQMIVAMGPGLDHTVTQIRLALTPTFSIGMKESDMSHIILTQQFDFSAAHRLHAPELSDAENRSVFGKCNNPNGHGHNYRLEVSVLVPESGLCSFGAGELDQLVDEVIIEPFDHQHLNVDTEAFAQTNPSVENMVAHFVSILTPELQQRGMQLESMSLWETEKTRATWRASMVGSATLA